MVSEAVQPPEVAETSRQRKRC